MSLALAYRGENSAYRRRVRECRAAWAHAEYADRSSDVARDRARIAWPASPPAQIDDLARLQAARRRFVLRHLARRKQLAALGVIDSYSERQLRARLQPIVLRKAA